MTPYKRGDSHGEVFRGVKKLRENNQREARTKINVMRLLAWLEEVYEGKKEVSPTQLGAAKLLLDRTIPVLSATDVYHHDEPQLSEEQMVARLGELVSKLPASVRDRLALPPMLRVVNDS